MTQLSNYNPLLIQHNELIAYSPLADQLEQTAISLKDSLGSDQMVTMLMSIDRLRARAVLELDKKSVLAWIANIDDMAERARYLGYYMHAYVNQWYDDKPYSYHIQKVADAAIELFSDVLTADEMVILVCACYLHDTIEDCRMTFNDVATIMGHAVAERVYLVTNYRGKNRKERAPIGYYVDIFADLIADALKVSDRYANMLEGFVQGGGGMFKGYVKDNTEFVRVLYRSDLKLGFDRFTNSVNDWVAILKERAEITV